MYIPFATDVRRGYRLGRHPVVYSEGQPFNPLNVQLTSSGTLHDVQHTLSRLVLQLPLLVPVGWTGSTQAYPVYGMGA